MLIIPTYPMLAGGPNIGGNPDWHFCPTLSNKRVGRCLSRVRAYHTYWYRYSIPQGWLNGGYSTMPSLFEINTLLHQWWLDLPDLEKIIYDDSMQMNSEVPQQVATRNKFCLPKRNNGDPLPTDDLEYYLQALCGGYAVWCGLIYEYQMWTNVLQSINKRGRPRKKV